ncbi:hypothetical protein QMK17_26095, partial [Rhodococcus sp. G-MC3]|uniref:hypothetical protein n=1 Tax=Rhodococcus sp. G-MC3 TaxID=3046209 RepID=UPI0024B8F74F
HLRDALLVVRIGSVESPIRPPQQGISRLTRMLSGYLIGAFRFNDDQCNFVLSLSAGHLTKKHQAQLAVERARLRDELGYSGT